MSKNDMDTDTTQMPDAVPARAAGENADATHIEDGRTGPAIGDTDAQPVTTTDAPTEAGDGQGAPSVAEAAGQQRTEMAGELDALKERVAQLERETAAERERATDYMQKWQRAQADFSNFRRRAQQDQQQLAAIAAEEAMKFVLPALDSLERAFKTVPETLRGLTWIDGIALVELQLHRTLQAFGVQSYEPKAGETFDPSRHDSIAHVETSAHPDGAVVEVLQRGYELQGRVLRPALVSVARGLASTATEPGDRNDTTAPPGPSGSSP